MFHILFTIIQDVGSCTVDLSVTRCGRRCRDDVRDRNISGSYQDLPAPSRPHRRQVGFIFTACQRICRKVVLSIVSVCLSFCLFTGTDSPCDHFLWCHWLVTVHILLHPHHTPLPPARPVQTCSLGPHHKGTYRTCSSCIPDICRQAGSWHLTEREHVSISFAFQMSNFQIH